MHQASRHFFVRSTIAASCGLSTVLAGCGGGAATASPELVSAGAATSAAIDKGLPATSDASAEVLSSGAARSDTPEAHEEVNSGAAELTVLKCRSDSVSAAAGVTTWGTFDRPFAANSPWNSRPVNAVLGATTIPTSSYFPSIAGGAYGTAAFQATAADGPVTVTGTESYGVWDPDSEVFRSSIVIPRWPAGVAPAVGSDGHAEVVDTVTGIVHSFWQLRQIGGAWKAAQYAWSPLAGRGMGDPAHYWQGARSAGVSTIGGLMRIGEVKDGDTMYRHALAMSLTFNGLASNPAYQFPVTGADGDAATTNSGTIPIGSLMMLPPNFDAQSLATPILRKVAETLKTYGAYVVDRNWGTPFVIYVENGADFYLHPNGWDNATAADLDRMRQALRPLASAAKWVDGNGRAYQPNTALNLLSMRGYWYVTKGSQAGVYDTWRQAVVFPATTSSIEQVNGGGRAFSGINWAIPIVGSRYRLTSFATGGASFRMTVTDRGTGAVVYDSGYMANGQTATLGWPARDFLVSTYVKSGTGNVESTIRAELVSVSSAAVAAGTSEQQSGTVMLGSCGV